MEKHPFYQFEKYSDKACRAIMEARRWAGKQKTNLLSSHYILAGLMEAEPELLQNFFKSTQLSLDEVFEHIQFRKHEQEPRSSNLANVSHISLKILSRAAAEATYAHAPYIETSHILNSLIKEPKSIGSEILEVVARRATAKQEKIKKYSPRKIYSSKTKHAASAKKKEKNLFARFCFDLTQAARAGKLPPMIGREKELQQLLHTLGRKSKNNPVLVGEAGVGKTAIIEGLAQKIAAQEVHSAFAHKTILRLDLTSVIAGTKYRGEFEERLRDIVEAVKLRDDILLFIDEVHSIVGVGASEGALDAANIMKPALARGELHCIGATTPQEFQRHFKQDKALARRFQAITVDEPCTAEVRDIAFGIRTHYEVFHQVHLHDRIIDQAIYLAEHFLPERAMPDKVIDLLDEACSRTKLENGQKTGKMPAVKSRTLQKIVSNWAGVPVQDINFNEKQALLNIENRLQREIFGQDHAIAKIARAVRRRRTGIHLPQKPVGIFLFTGPTGVGKTAMAQALARHLMGSTSALIRLDMSEFKEAHSISKIIGAPPGYVGFQQSSYLTERIRKHPYSVVLFDEIEKAHSDVYNLLLQIFDEGRLHDAAGCEIDFRHTVIIMTSNLKTENATDGGDFGFSRKTVAQAGSQRIPRPVRQYFSPEFINRLDGVIQFHHLDKKVLGKILRKLIRQLNREMPQKNLSVELSRGVQKKLIGYALQEKQYGARPLKRLLAEYIEDELSLHLLSDNFTDGKVVRFFIGQHGEIANKIGAAASAGCSG